VAGPVEETTTEGTVSLSKSDESGTSKELS
jgi:hypothetical protein